MRILPLATLLVLLPAYSNAAALKSTTLTAPAAPITKVVKLAVKKPVLKKKIKPRVPHYHDLYPRPIMTSSRVIEAVRFIENDKQRSEGCRILKASDPDDDMAFLLWSAYIDSPRHATRAAWEKFENQPIFFRMAKAAISICTPISTTAGPEK